MSGDDAGGAPGFTIEAAHAADKAKRITYPARPATDAPDYDRLRDRALQATKQARRDLDDGQG